MRVFRWIACGAMLLPGYALSQTAGAETLLADVSTSADPTADLRVQFASHDSPRVCTDDDE